jgi:MFS family permease
VLVGALAGTVTVSHGVLMYAFPVVLPAMQADLGWSQPVLTGGYAVASLVAGVASIPVGRWVDRHGPRLVMTVGSISASILVVAWSRVEHPAAFYAIWLGLGACMAALFYEPAFAVAAHWFRRHRARALGAITAAGGLASTLFVPATAALVATLGWRDALLALAVALGALTIVPHAWLLRRRPADLGLEVDGDPAPTATAPGPVAERRPAEVLRAPSFRWLGAALLLSTFANAAFAVHLIPLLLERGHGVGSASLALGAVGVTKLFGRLALAPLTERTTPCAAMVGMLLLHALGLVALNAAPGPVGVWTCVALFGTGDGAGTPARAAIVADLYGAAQYGATSGVLAAGSAAGRAGAPVAASLVHAASGGYDAVLWLLTGVVLLAAAALRTAEARHRDGSPQEVRPFRTPAVSPSEP